MWKYVTFVLLMALCLTAVLGQSDVDGVTNTQGLSTVSQDLGDPSINITTVVLPTTSDNPTTSTEVPATSTEIPATSTEVPITSTLVPTTTPPSPEESTTTSGVTTVPPVTTALPPPDVVKYTVVDEKNDTCLRVEMALRVYISDLPISYNFPGNASTVGSTCNSSNDEILKLADEDLGHNLSFTFVQQDKKYYVQNITFDYITPEGMKPVETTGQFFSASNGKSYLCKSDVSIHLGNVTLTFSSVQVQAFGAQSFGLAEECDADDKVGDIVPIAVGCALGALVVIVLIAYLVGRRRSRQRGYQSV